MLHGFCLHEPYLVLQNTGDAEYRPDKVFESLFDSDHERSSHDVVMRSVGRVLMRYHLPHLNRTEMRRRPDKVRVREAHRFSAWDEDSSSEKARINAALRKLLIRKPWAGGTMVLDKDENVKPLFLLDAMRYNNTEFLRTPPMKLDRAMKKMVKGGEINGVLIVGQTPRFEPKPKPKKPSTPKGPKPKPAPLKPVRPKIPTHRKDEEEKKPAAEVELTKYVFPEAKVEMTLMTTPRNDAELSKFYIEAMRDFTRNHKLEEKRWLAFVNKYHKKRKRIVDKRDGREPRSLEDQEETVSSNLPCCFPRFLGGEYFTVAFHE